MKILMIFFIPFLLFGCVYEIEPTLAYIPPLERPIRFYRYNDFWYAEPYVFFTYEDSYGYRTRRKIPVSKLKFYARSNSSLMKNKKDVDSLIKDVEKMKQYQDRRKNRGRMRKRR